MSRADVRYAVFNSVGNVAFFLVFLVFLNAALDAMRVTVLSNLIQNSVLFFPKLFIALLIVALGWLIAGRVAIAVQKALTKEEVPRATLIARFTRSLLILFFGAMALAQLDIAREIVVVTIITLGALTVIFASFGGKELVKKLLESLEEK